MNMRLVDPYSLHERASRAGINGQQPMNGYESQLLGGRMQNNGNQIGDFRPNALNLISNLEYPSESNRGWYITLRGKFLDNLKTRISENCLYHLKSNII